MDQEKSYHLEMLAQKNYITDVEVNPEYNRKVGPIRLTFDGHEFLETIKSQKIWDKTKSTIKEKGVGLTIDAIAKLASAVAASMLTASK